MFSEKLLRVVLASLPLLTVPQASARAAEVYQLTGEKGPGGELTLGLIVGEDGTLAARVYAEPSHTLLLLVIDRDYSLSTEGATWLTLHQPSARATAKTDLPDGAVRVTIPQPPASDDRIAVWLLGSWDGATEDRLVADARVEPQDKFELSLGLTPPKEAQ
jgi:hypothetical protein